MAGDRTICTVNGVSYIDIRKAMIGSARTADEIAEMTGTCNACEGCKEELPKILASVCGCKGVSLDAVIKAVSSGADTADKVAAVTGAGIDCGRCQALVNNIIEIGR